MLKLISLQIIKPIDYMSRLSSTFSTLKTQGKSAFVPFITAGDGGLENSYNLMLKLTESGADIIEIGVPFSDPMADGPVIASSHERALTNKVSLNDVLILVKKFRKVNQSTAIVLMGYLNPIEAFGYENFAKKSADSGVDGVLVIDMPPEEATNLKSNLTSVNIDLIFLIATTTTDARLKFLATVASGFVYFVSLKGITGANTLNIKIVNNNIRRIRKHISLPIGVGFGIKDAKTASAVSKISDAVIIGSAIVSIIEKHNDDNYKTLDKVGVFTLELAKAIKHQ